MTYGIVQVSSIRAINLRGCNLSGMLQSDMYTDIPKLKTLDLSRNQLYGEIPPNIYKCKDLEDLSLSYNHFNGNIPSEIRTLVNLKLLALDDNSFGRGIPKEFGNLTSLNSLYLDDNKMTGELPQELSNLAYLEKLTVGNNALSGSIPPFMFNISTLKIMNLQSNHFSGSLPSTIGMGFSLLNLENLSLDTNRLSGAIPSYINNASKLTLLQMQNNSFTGYVPNFGNLRLLQDLRIWENNLTGDLRFLSSLTNCRHLKALEISTNPLNGVIPTSIGNLSTSLQDFQAAECGIKGAIPSEIGNLSSLLKLSLHSNQLTGFIPTTLGKLEQLQGIFLYNNTLQGYIAPHLCKMSHLVSLFLYDNMLTGAIPECLGELTSLREVYLGSNNLNSTIPSNFWNLIDLLTLNLSSNNFSGQISPDIGSLKVINSLDLSWNQFSGDIPSSIGNPQSIEFLSLAHNKFEGEIPTGDLLLTSQLNRLFKNLALCGATRFHVPVLCLTHKRSRTKNVSTLLVNYVLPPSSQPSFWWYRLEKNFISRTSTWNKCISETNLLEGEDCSVFKGILSEGHTFPVVHCDMKPSNILLDEDMTAHVADFGLSKLFDDGEVVIQTNTLATIGYTAPELPDLEELYALGNWNTEPTLYWPLIFSRKWRDVSYQISYPTLSKTYSTYTNKKIRGGGDASHCVGFEPILIEENFSYEEFPLRIVDTKTRSYDAGTIPMQKSNGPTTLSGRKKATWEARGNLRNAIRTSSRNQVSKFFKFRGRNLY
ncbi:hypothetical protein BUALT_Bualt08G0127100 [Buddleja alternifolia]|uniref:Protein kinase domain-containing protein n=1 Tax=Buddleja alternifolia TaxID=168488 RepID=A0AAV6X7I1_9LAMI|nr:hypothetical protein BUALT_Bualt08G0127100 [Buddleja alternifolia]